MLFQIIEIFNGRLDPTRVQHQITDEQVVGFGILYYAPSVVLHSRICTVVVLTVFVKV